MSNRFIMPQADVGKGISPSDGAQLFFFGTGTVVKKDIFSDGIGTASANPVVSDSSGVFPEIWIDGAYKVVLRDKNNRLSGFGVADPVTSQGAEAVATYAELDARLSSNYADGQTVTVTNESIFSFWVASTGAHTANVGAIRTFGDDAGRFWRNSQDLAVRGEAFLADNTGITDSTPAMLESNYTQSSEIRLGNGTFKMNKWMELNSIKGNGYSTEIKPFSAVTNDGFALSLGAHSLPYGAFDFQWVRDLSMDGEGTGCIRFDDEDDVDGDDLSSVGWLLENLALRSLGGGKCVKAEFGSIGNKYNNIAAYGSDYHFWLQDNRFSIQHTGATTWSGNHLQRADVASIYISDNQGGRGHWRINDSIIENNHGFGIFCKSDSAVPNIGAFLINSVWFEKNGLAATPLIPGNTVEIDSVTYTPRDMRFEKFGSIVVNACHFNSIDIIESDVVAHNCRHDNDQNPAFYNVTKDKDSTINLTNPSGANQFGACDEWSHTAPASTVDYFSNRSPMLRMEHRRTKAVATRRTSNSQGFEKVVSGNYTFGVGVTGAQVSDGILFDTCLETTTTASQTSGSAIIGESATSVGGLGGLSTPTVTGITAANPPVVTAATHGYVNSQLVNFVAGTGMEELAGDHYIDYIDANSFSIRGVDASAYTAWSAGGTFAGISSYAVMTIATKVMSGLANLTSIAWNNNSAGNVGLIRTGALEEWVTTVCMIKMVDTGIGFPNASIMFKTNSGGSAVVRVADFQVAAFPTKQEASDFIHSGIFEYTA
jgi:hypothetical protein